MNLNSYNRWKAGVVHHYGSLEEFPDARTIRIMRAGLLEQLNEYLKWVREAKNKETKKTLREVFQDDAKVAAEEISALDKWLKEKGLEP